MDHLTVIKLGAGGSRPIILVPGLSSPRTVWNGVAPTLAQHRPVYLVQVNGFACDAAGANLAPGILDGLVDDLRALMVRERISDAAVVGRSLGGIVALKLALAHPRRVGRLMIVESLPFVGAMFMDDATVEQIEPIARIIRAQMRARHSDGLDPNETQAIANYNALKPPSRALVA